MTGFRDDLHPRVDDGTFTSKTQATPEIELESAGDNYIEVEGGLVQNSPSLPILDLDFLRDSTDDIEHAAITYERAARLGLDDYAQRIANWGAHVEGWKTPDVQISAERAEDDQYIHLEGGLVQNRTNLPVIDLDFLDGSFSGDAEEEALSTLEYARELGLTEIVERIATWVEIGG